MPMLSLEEKKDRKWSFGGRGLPDRTVINVVLFIAVVALAVTAILLAASLLWRAFQG